MASRRAFVAIDGRVRYLAPYNSEETKVAFRRCIAEHASGAVAEQHRGIVSPDSVLAAYWKVYTRNYTANATAASTGNYLTSSPDWMHSIVA